MKSTPEMRARIRELMTEPMDDYDRAVACVLDDLDAILGDAYSSWQPIETAPKDEMFIWAYRRDGKWSIGLAYRNVSGGWSCAYGSDAPRHATHWCPLPPPPSMTSTEGKAGDPQRKAKVGGIDIVDRLRFDAIRCEMQFSKGVAGNITEAANEIERLRAGIETERRKSSP